jgi:hypothetical protein
MIKSNSHCFRLLALKLVILLCASFLFGLFSCKANYIQEPALKEIAVRELGNDYTFLFNESKTYALCHQKQSNDHPDRKIKYIVLEISTKEIVTRGSFQSGYVKWYSNDSIEVATSEKLSSELRKTIIPVKSNL